MNPLDGFSRKAAAGNDFGGYALYESPQDSIDYGPRFWTWLDEDIVSLIAEYRQKIARADARYIATWSDVHCALEQKADYVSAGGWTTEFWGNDEAFGEMLEDFLEQADKLADVRGSPFTLAKVFELGCRMWDTDGDFFILLCKTATGYPVGQFLESHRVGSRGQPAGKIVGGAFDGAQIVNGIIYDDSAKIIGARFLGATPERDVNISANDFIYCANPTWLSDGRPLPTLAYGILDFYDAKETQAAEKTAAKANSSLAIIEENEAGKGPQNPMTGGKSGNQRVDLLSPQGLQTQIMEKGLIRYIKSKSGKISAHSSNRPSSGWMDFQNMITGKGIRAMGWRPEMLDPRHLKGANCRAVQDCVNTTIQSRFGALAQFAIRFQQWRISVFQNRGDLPDHPEWWKIGMARPPDFTVDEGRQRQADREDCRVGLQSEPVVLQRNGQKPRKFLRQRAQYLKMKNEVAAEYGLQTADLGTFALPGDAVAPLAAEPAGGGDAGEDDNS